MPESGASSIVERYPVQASLWAAGLYGVALLLIFHQTTWSMVSIWLRSDTFTHGFLILPISLWLVWDRRESIRLISPRPALWVAILVIPPGFVWLLAWLVDVLVVQQLALVAMLVVGAWAILGHQLARELSFSLLFLFLAVPMGEALVPPMMEFTATSTVWLIQQTGVPVYREALYFSLPSGDWSVVEACSGVRYIIASITLGVLYAYLTYRSLWRRILFVLASAIVPVFANTARAYMIVMLGHLSNMRLATGVDHLIYGWVFFGIVVFLLFWLGSFFREDNSPAPRDGSDHATLVHAPGRATSKLLTATALVLLTVGVWPLLAYNMGARLSTGMLPVVEPPMAVSPWQALPVPARQWQPDSAVGGQSIAYYAMEGKAAVLFIQYRDGTEADGDVIGSSTRFVDKNSGVRVLRRDKSTVRINDMPVLVDQAQLRGAGDQLLVWSWYRIGELHTSNDYLAKFREAWASLGLGSAGSYRIVLAVPQQDSVTSSQALLQDFLNKHGGQLDAALDRATEGLP